ALADEVTIFSARCDDVATPLLANAAPADDPFTVDATTPEGAMTAEPRYGPAPEKAEFWWGTVKARLTPQQWELAKYLWPIVRTGRNAKVDAVWAAVWGDSKTKFSRKRITNAVNALSDALRSQRVPVEYGVTTDTGFVCLRASPPDFDEVADSAAAGPG